MILALGFSHDQCSYLLSWAESQNSCIQFSNAEDLKESDLRDFDFLIIPEKPNLFTGSTVVKNHRNRAITIESKYIFKEVTFYKYKTKARK